MKIIVKDQTVSYLFFSNKTDLFCTNSTPRVHYISKKQKKIIETYAMKDFLRKQNENLQSCLLFYYKSKAPITTTTATTTTKT